MGGGVVKKLSAFTRSILLSALASNSSTNWGLKRSSKTSERAGWHPDKKIRIAGIKQQKLRYTRFFTDKN
jgi:hypothetical protein